jgi:hypothetical protein
MSQTNSPRLAARRARAMRSLSSVRSATLRASRRRAAALPSPGRPGRPGRRSGRRVDGPGLGVLDGQQADDLARRGLQRRAGEEAAVGAPGAQGLAGGRGEIGLRDDADSRRRSLRPAGRGSSTWSKPTLAFSQTGPCRSGGSPRAGAEQARGQADDPVESRVGRVAVEGAKGVEGAQPARLVIICQRSARIVHDSTIDWVRAGARSIKRRSFKQLRRSPVVKLQPWRYNGTRRLGFALCGRSFAAARPQKPEPRTGDSHARQRPEPRPQ